MDDLFTFQVAILGGPIRPFASTSFGPSPCDIPCYSSFHSEDRFLVWKNIFIDFNLLISLKSGIIIAVILYLLVTYVLKIIYIYSSLF